MNKKAFIFKIFYFIMFIIAAILLGFLIKNGWDVKAAFSDILSRI